MGRSRFKGKSAELVPCACGCGQMIMNCDKQGRENEFAVGHHIPLYGEFRFNNPIAQCACGCGGSRYLYDNKGRKRRFIAGHGRRKVGDLNYIKEIIEIEGTPTLAGLALGLDKSSITSLMKRNHIEYFTDLTKVGGITAFGRKAELNALRLLPGSEDATCNDPKKSPFDILWNGKRINVKASTIKSGGKGHYTRWTFQTEKPEQCDYFFCLGYKGEHHIAVALLIPSNVAPICVSFPTTYNTKWMQYALNDGHVIAI